MDEQARLFPPPDAPNSRPKSEMKMPKFKIYCKRTILPHRTNNLVSSFAFDHIGESRSLPVFLKANTVSGFCYLVDKE